MNIVVKAGTNPSEAFPCYDKKWDNRQTHQLTTQQNQLWLKKFY